MSGIDKQRIAAVRILEGMGFTFDGSTWHPPLTKPASSLTGAADTLHALLVRRADDLSGCAQGSPEDHELRAIMKALVNYEGARWPQGRTADGKGGWDLGQLVLSP